MTWPNTRLAKAVLNGGLIERNEVKRALQALACWPPEGPLRAGCAELAGIPKPAPGRAIFVTASGDRSSLWRLEPEAADGNTTIGFSPSASTAIQTAREVVSRDVAALARPERISHPPPWRARLLARDGTGQDAVVDGGSLGLAAALAIVSDLGEVPVPSDVLAAATIDSAGKLGTVEELRTKLRVVREWAPGLRRLLVAPEQREEALRLVGELDLDLDVPDLPQLADMIAEVFPTLFGDLAARWSQDPMRAKEVAQRLFHMAVENRIQLQDWRGLARTADTIASALGSEDGAIEARIAGAIAARHCGEPRVMDLPHDWFSQQTRARRRALVAHLVQNATDCVDESWADAEHLALDHLAQPEDWEQADLRLAGALGRAYAAWHRWEDAELQLGRAASGWLENGWVGEASYPMCELLRVMGILGDEGGVAATVERVERLITDPDVPDISRQFLELAVIRALVQTAQWTRALEWDEARARNWARAPNHVQASRLRWRILALRAVGRDDDARHDMEELSRLADEPRGEVLYALHLARLDEALEHQDRDACEAAIRELEVREGPSVARIRAHANPAGFHQAIARYWPY